MTFFNNMFTPLGINHTHNTHAATNHLFGIPQNRAIYYGTYSLTSIASVTWNDLLRNTNQNFLDCKINEFKRTIFQAFLTKYSNNN